MAQGCDRRAGHLVALSPQLGQQLVKQHHLARGLHQPLELRQLLPLHGVLEGHMVLHALAQKLQRASSHLVRLPKTGQPYLYSHGVCNNPPLA